MEGTAHKAFCIGFVDVPCRLHFFLGFFSILFLIFAHLWWFGGWGFGVGVLDWVFGVGVFS